jgi:trigger factor
MNKYQVEVSEEELDEMADKFIKSKLNWQKQDSIYLSNFGDIVVINYHGNINGNSFEGGDGENYRLELGSQTFIDNFEEQLVGKISGQKVQVHVTFPSDYFRPQLSNQKAVFDVEILEILKADHPVLDSAFIKEVTGYEDIEDLKDALYDQAIFSYDATCRAIFKKELFDYLDSAYNIELPVGLVNEQTNFLKNIPGQQNPVKNDDSVEGRLKNLKLSQRMVRCGLILAEIANLNNISVSKEDVDNEIENIVNLYPEQKDEVLKMYNTNKQAVQQLQGAILEEKTVNFILSNINTVTIPVTTKQVDRLWFDITNNN